MKSAPLSLLSTPCKSALCWGAVQVAGRCGMIGECPVLADWPNRKLPPDLPRKWRHTVNFGDGRGNQM